MNEYIITFFAHFGAVKAMKRCNELNIKAQMMPVPRSLSSSCGTCISLYAKEENLKVFTAPEFADVVESIACCIGKEYKEVYSSI